MLATLRTTPPERPALHSSHIICHTRAIPLLTHKHTSCSLMAARPLTLTLLKAECALDVVDWVLCA
jgi:hypothetical protein